VESRRRSLVAERPGAEAEAQRHFARAEMARKLRNETAALRSYEEALRADPLNLDIHKAYWEFRRLREDSRPQG